MTPYMAMIKVLTSLISYSTKPRHKRGVHSNETAQILRWKFPSVYVKRLSIGTLLAFILLLQIFTINILSPIKYSQHIQFHVLQNLTIPFVVVLRPR